MHNNLPFQMHKSLISFLKEPIDVSVILVNRNFSFNSSYGYPFIVRICFYKLFRNFSVKICSMRQFLYRRSLALKDCFMFR